jgi:hypothetical protein
VCGGSSPGRHQPGVLLGDDCFEVDYENAGRLARSGHFPLLIHVTLDKQNVIRPLGRFYV